MNMVILLSPENGWNATEKAAAAAERLKQLEGLGNQFLHLKECYRLKFYIFYHSM
ncbi:MAG: hypothetical protein H0Z32_10240 [Bacillaceae bacterium]|nr:hypothetical protein [Bacillaceae bacterium]